MKTFDEIYILDLHGNANRKEKSPDGTKDENVFDIKQGVAISIFVRRDDKSATKDCKVYRHDVYEERNSKNKYLSENDVLSTKWHQLRPSSPRYPFKKASDDKIYLDWASISEIYSPYGDPAPGILTTHDSFAISFTSEGITENLKKLGATKNETEARKQFKLCAQNQWSYSSAKEYIGLGTYAESVVEIEYRPFDTRFTVYNSEIAVHLRKRVSENMLHPNISLVTNKSVEGDKDWEHVFVSNGLITHHSISIKEINYQFPLYLYPHCAQNVLLAQTTTWPIDAQERTPNLGKPFIEALSKANGLKFAPAGASGPEEYSPEDVFHYIYAVLHSPSYRARYADFLRSDFPRIPLPDTAERFRELAALGGELSAQHLLKTAVKLGGFPKSGSSEVEKGYPKFSPPGTGETEGKVMINPAQWFSGITPEVWEFRVGGYQVAEKWLKDRRGRVLSLAEQNHYQKALGALAATITLMEQVDEAIEGLIPV